VPKLRGKVEDLGDVVIHTEVLVKGFHWAVVFKIGVHRDIPPELRPLPQPRTPLITCGRIDLIMDLGADKQVALAATFTDEVGNPVAAPAGATVTWTTDNATVIALTTNPDNSANAAATGTLGSAIVHVEVGFPNGTTASGDLLINVVAGEAERVTITPGEVTEVTPDV